MFIIHCLVLSAAFPTRQTIFRSELKHCAVVVRVLQHLPVPINETGIDVVGALHSSNGLKTHSCGLIWHYVNKAVLELVAGEIGTDES